MQDKNKVDAKYFFIAFKNIALWVVMMTIMFALIRISGTDHYESLCWISGISAWLYCACKCGIEMIDNSEDEE